MPHRFYVNLPTARRNFAFYGTMGLVDDFDKLKSDENPLVQKSGKISGLREIYTYLLVG